jgi:antitoxin YefM
MQVLTYSQARANLAEAMDSVLNDGDEVIVTRRNRKAVVMISLDAWNAIQETMHLLSTPANARALRRSIEELDAGKGVERALLDP